MPAASTPIAGLAVPATLTALGTLHAAWALGWRWPGGNDEAFVERVFSGDELPPTWAVWVVAVGLTGLGGVTRAAARKQAAGPRGATRVLAAVLAARSVRGVVRSLTHDDRGLYERLDLTVYAPLCATLAIGCGRIAWARPD